MPCPSCNSYDLENPGALLFASGRKMSINEWNGYYNEDGTLVDPNNDPAHFNRHSHAL